MMTFWMIAALMIVVALVAVTLPMLRGDGGDGVDDDDVAEAVQRHRRAELDDEARSGVLGDDALDEARRELDRTAAADNALAADRLATARGPAGTRALVVAAMVLPVVAAGLYLWLGEPGAIEAPRPAKTALPSQHPDVAQGAAGGADQHSVDDMTSRLEQRLAEKPDDAEGWTLLGRTYMYSKRAADAVKAFERARKLKGDDPKLMADAAEAMAVAGGNRIDGESARLVRAALEREPANPKALWLAGAEQLQKGNGPGAAVHWRKLLGQLLPGSPEAQALEGYIAQAEAGVTRLERTPPVATAGNAASIASGASVRVQVALDPAMKAHASPDDTVFIYARAAKGPRMPLAMLRKQVRDLPADVVLDDSSAMGPGMNLSRFGEVVVSARVSKSGEATPRRGDLEGQSGVIRVSAAAPVAIRIVRVVQ
ncbi:MAG: c-type cytochrome biogenesis protein CcmI [Burkholderiales bacterium]